MKLSKEIKDKIKAEYESWFESQYGNSTQEERDKLGAIFTPPDITIAMIEKLDNLNGDILDPCCGSGNLLAGCIIAGADPNKVYGNEYDEEFMLLAKNRLSKLGVPEWHIHQGNALQKLCLTDFGKEYEDNYNPEYIDDLKYAQGYLVLTQGRQGTKQTWAEMNAAAVKRAKRSESTSFWDI